MIKRTFYIIILVLSFSIAYALDVVPGLKGFGTDTRAAYGDSTNPTIFIVDDITDNNGTPGNSTRNGVAVKTGSFREAINYDVDNKMIIFETSGTIDMGGLVLSLDNDNISILGQTAPSPGVTIRAMKLVVSGDDILISHLRTRMGDDELENDLDGINVTGTGQNNVVVDHCSISWSIDELVGVGGNSVANSNSNITFSNCIFGEALDENSHPTRSGGHSAGMLISNVSNLSLINNLFIHNVYRNVGIEGQTTAAVINNYVYNLETFQPMINRDNDSEYVKLSYVGNVIEGGSESTYNSRNYTFRWYDVPRNVNTELYVSDNECDAGSGGWAYTYDPFDGDIEENYKVLTAPLWPTGVTAIAASEVLAYITANAGAYPNDRDAVDTRLIGDLDDTPSYIKDTVNWTNADCTALDLIGSDTMECCEGAGTGHCIQVDEAGWPSLAVNTTTHSDIPASPHADDDTDGYTNLEEWIHAFVDPVESDSAIQGIDPAGIKFN